MKRTLTFTAALAAAIVGLPAASAVTAADAAGTGYVALGDSYSAGVGTRDKVNDCYQSPYGYPRLIAAARGLTLSYQSCSGATTSDVATKQLAPLSPTTAYVTLTVGGNDVNFAATITECALPSWMSDCSGKIAADRAILTGALPGRLDSLYASIRAKASKATVVVAGYPHIFQGQDCNALTFFSPSEEAAINSATDDLDTLVKTKSGAHGFSFVDVRGAFTGHAVCDSTEWLNGLSNPIQESYHPNQLGNVAYANAIGPKLGARTAVVPAQAEPPQAEPATGGAETGGGQAGAASAALTPASAGGRLRTGSSPLAVDLASPASLSGARAYGIDPATLQALQADLESGDQARVMAAVARAKALSAQVDSTKAARGQS